jgi:tetratricopeptide (TPR) repeat protein
MERGRMFFLVAVWGTLAAVGCGKVDPRWEGPGRSDPAEDQTGALARRRAEVTEKPLSAEAHVRLATEYFQQNQLQAAAEEFRRALELQPRNAAAALGLSQVAARLNDTANALAWAQYAAQLRPQDPEVLQHRAAVLQQAGQWQEAARAFEQAQALRPRDLTIRLNAAQCWAEAKEWNRAEAACRQAEEVAPQALEPRLLRGDLDLRQGRTVQAAAQLERLAREQPRRAAAHEALGRARKAQGRLPEALAAFTQAQRLAPQWFEPYLQAGGVCLRLKAYRNAEQHLEKALQLSPRSPAARSGLAEVLLAQGKQDQAIEVYEKLLEDGSDHPGVLNNLAYLYAQKGENLDRALDLARRAARASPEDSAAQDTLGWVCYRAGRSQEALDHLREAVRLSPERGRYHYHLGQALLTAGRRREAAESLRTALSRGLSPDEKKAAESSLADLTAK